MSSQHWFAVLRCGGRLGGMCSMPGWHELHLKRTFVHELVVCLLWIYTCDVRPSCTHNRHPYPRCLIDVQKKLQLTTIGRPNRGFLLCRPKDQGGLGILDLQLQNKCLLVKWLVNLLNTEGTWQSLLTNKYLRSKTLTQVTAKPHDSHFWRGLMRIKDEVLAKGSFDIKDGTKMRFWDDIWVGDKPLKVKYPSLYNTVRDRHATVSKVLASTPLNISFRRALVGNKLLEWLNLVAQISNVELVGGSDYFRWNLTKSGLFSVRSLYLHLIDTQPPFLHRKLWKIKIPLKIKIFLWFLQRGVVLTKDNLARKN
jgi:hypothetical protein